MKPPMASCLLEVTTGQPPEPFALSLDNGLGSRPVLVNPLRVNAWSQQSGIYDALLPTALRLKGMGFRRVRLHCSNRPMGEVRLVVDGGGPYRPLGRRQEPIRETLTWLQSQSQFLRFGYDQPAVTILESTRFFDNDGQETSRPLYLPEQGLFRHAQPVTGAMVVEYQPAYFLYEIDYGTGEEMMSVKAFLEIKRAWLAGNIHDAALPPVRLIALSRHQAAQLAFPRAFWPLSSSATMQFQDTEAVQSCLDENGQEQYQYVENSRETSSERIVSRNDPNSYVDILRTVSMAFERQPVNGGLCEEATAGSQSQKMFLRFQNPRNQA